MAESDKPVVIVTGAGRGIGEGIARRLASDGWHVIAVDRDPELLASTFASDPHIEPLVLDVTDRAAVAQAFADVDQRLGRIDGVVSNAMRVHYRPLAEMDDETLDAMIDVGLKATFWVIQAALPSMRRRGGGSIVTMSSPAATRGMPGSSAYSAVKGAVSSLTWQASRELGDDGIRVNGVIPGAVPTPGARSVVDDEGYEVRRRMSALGRLGTPDDIAAAVAFLLSADAAFVTGHLLAVDGGL